MARTVVESISFPRASAKCSACSSSISATIPHALPSVEISCIRVRGAELPRKIPPRTAHSIEIEHRFKKVSLTQPSRCSGLRMLCLFDRCFKLLPNSIANHSSGMFFRHPKSESDCLKFVHLKIREHNLVQPSAMKFEIGRVPVFLSGFWHQKTGR